MFFAVDDGRSLSCGNQTKGVGAIDFFLPDEARKRPAGVIGIYGSIDDAIKNNAVVIGKYDDEFRPCNLAMEILHLQFCQATHDTFLLPPGVQILIIDLNLIGRTKRIESDAETALPG